MRLIFFIIFIIISCKTNQSQKKIIVQEQNHPELESEEGENYFYYKIQYPQIEIIVPEIPNIPLNEHPLSKSYNQFKYLGSEDNFTISILLHEEKDGITEKECALINYENIIQKQYLSKNSVKTILGDDKRTYSMYYKLIVGELIQLHSHLFSAIDSKYCIEIHISKFIEDNDEINSWMRGFRKAKIKSGFY